MDIDQRRARREARRREHARRRARGLAAVVVLAAVALLAAVLIETGVFSSPGSASRSADATGRAGAHTRARGSGSDEQNPPGQSTGAGTGQGSGVGAARASGGNGTRASSGATRDVPILMYHVINPPPPGAKFPGLYVAPEEFAAQMTALAQAGFHAVTMDQMLAHWTRAAPLPAGKPIVVSFDNGYQSQLTQALPVLRRLGWVGVENIQLTGLPPSQGGLSEAQVRELVAAGWELDTQGFSHADLITLGAAALHYQVAVARTEVQRRYHVPVNWFCYPSGHYNATVIAEVKTAGFLGSTTVVPGWATPTEDPYRLPRLRVLGGTSPQALLSQIASTRSAASPPASYGPGG